MASAMNVCHNCRQALRRIGQRRVPSLQQRQSSTGFSIQDILSKPTWSVRSLLAPDSEACSTEKITPTQLHHLLRLSALPLPKSKDEEDSMIATLQSQLQFVRAVQRVDTTGVEPLSAIRDETEHALRENTIGLEELKDALAKEVREGHYKRPRRVKEKLAPDEEKWDALATASRKAGRYFVVDSAKKQDPVA
ncbi:Glutamyl-tRNA(Gln) amidotransferase subunit F [Paramyrothecium foliicola]|nr:Glutamyl-tRNA(Gln) amidotransferase subunit F [Paramyrothecium foliicola]